MTTIYVAGSTNDDLIRGLASSDCKERAESAQAIGMFHVYSALPFLLDMARNDDDPNVLHAAREAVVELTPSRDGADRSIAGLAPDGRTSQRVPQIEQAAAVIALFKEYRAARTVAFDALKSKKRRVATSAPAHALKELDLVAPVIDFLGAWGGLGATNLNDVGLAAAVAVGAIARFLEIPPMDAGPKSMSYRDAIARVAEYDSILPGYSSLEED